MQSTRTRSGRRRQRRGDQHRRTTTDLILRGSLRRPHLEGAIAFMRRILETVLMLRTLVVALFGMLLIGGVVAFAKLNIEAYPDPVPPLVDIVTQNPGQSAEEIERYITIPIEAGVSTAPYLSTMRTISLFG